MKRNFENETNFPSVPSARLNPNCPPVTGCVYARSESRPCGYAVKRGEKHHSDRKRGLATAKTVPLEMESRRDERNTDSLRRMGIPF